MPLCPPPSLVYAISITVRLSISLGLTETDSDSDRQRLGLTETRTDRDCHTLTLSRQGSLPREIEGEGRLVTCRPPPLPSLPPHNHSLTRAPTDPPTHRHCFSAGAVDFPPFSRRCGCCRCPHTSGSRNARVLPSRIPHLPVPGLRSFCARAVQCAAAFCSLLRARCLQCSLPSVLTESVLTAHCFQCSLSSVLTGFTPHWFHCQCSLPSLPTAFSSHCLHCQRPLPSVPTAFTAHGLQCSLCFSGLLSSSPLRPPPPARPVRPRAAPQIAGNSAKLCGSIRRRTRTVRFRPLLGRQ